MKSVAIFFVVACLGVGVFFLVKSRPDAGAAVARPGSAGSAMATGAVAAPVVVPVTMGGSSGMVGAGASSAQGREAVSAARRSVDEALATGRHPERLGSMILDPTPFDATRWASDPAYAQAWLDTHVPGRVFQPAQPGAGVPELSRIGDEDRDVLNGSEVELSVQVLPGLPVTFNAFDAGQFNGSMLSCVSVRADADGVATVRFAQSPGTVGRCRILAAGPMTSGQALFTVTFADPSTAAARGP